MRTLTVSLGVLVVCAVSAYAQTGTLSYWGATYADYTAGDHGLGDISQPTYFVNTPSHDTMWDYCYRLQYTSLPSTAVFWIDAPFDPYTILGTQTGGATAQYDIPNFDIPDPDWTPSWSNGRMLFTFNSSGPLSTSGTVDLQYWNDALGDSPPRHPVPATYQSGPPPANITLGNLHFGSEGFTLNDASGVYTNPEPSGLAFAGIVMGMVGGLWRRRKARKQ